MSLRTYLIIIVFIVLAVFVLVQTGIIPMEESSDTVSETSATTEELKEPADPKSLPVVQVARATVRSFPKHLDLSAPVEAYNTAVLTPKVSATVAVNYREQGDKVTKGEKLARLDDSDYRIALSSAQAQKNVADAGVEQARAGFEAAETNFKRFQTLLDQNTVSQADFDNAKNAYEQAKAGLTMAQAQQSAAAAGLRNARLRMRDTVIKAPFDGYVVERFRDVGEMASPQTPLFTVMHTDKLKINVGITELEQQYITPGITAEIRLDALPKQKITATVERINARVDMATKSVLVQLVMDNTDHIIKPGMTARIDFELPEHEYLTVPRAAVQTRDNESGIAYVLDSDNRIATVEIIMGGSSRGYALILSGLEESQRVVLAGGIRFENGQKVTPVEQETTP